MALDFNNLTPERVTSEAPTTGGRSRKYDVNPFAKAFAESVATREGRAYTLPVADVKEAAYLIRQAASDAEKGVRIVYSDVKGNVLDGDALKAVLATGKGNVKVAFWARPKRKYERKAAAPVTVTQVEAPQK